MAETLGLFFLDDRAEPPRPEGIDGLQGFSLWRGIRGPRETVAILRFDAEAPILAGDGALGASLAEAGWPPIHREVRLAMDPIPPYQVGEIEKGGPRAIHLARFPGTDGIESARSTRDRWVEAQPGFDVRVWHRGEDRATGDAWAIPMSLSPHGVSRETMNQYQDEYAGHFAWPGDLRTEEGEVVFAYEASR